MNQDQTPPGADKSEGDANAWRGFAEIDRAIAENRLTEYRWKKAWADPWSRRITIVVLGLLLAFCTYVVIYDVLLS